MPMKIMTIVGARPNFMKAAPIISAINKYNDQVAGAGTIQHILVHTGQHYDDIMSGSFFTDLNLPRPDVHLGVGSSSHALQTAEIMSKFEDVVMRDKPDVVIVVGDVNSTLACALVTAKISFDATGSRPLIAHVEAGLRSRDRAMPEEVNRIVTDHVSDLLFVTEQSGVRNLCEEAISPDRIHFVGNTMIDSLLNFLEKAESSTVLEDLGLRARRNNGSSPAVARYALLTLHRPSNVDDRDSFLKILEGLEDLAMDCPIIFPVHPRTRKRIDDFGFNLHPGTKKVPDAANGQNSETSRKGIVLTDPQNYLSFLCLMKNASIVVTDSGGIQEETTFLGVPCVTVRENTERPVTVERGTNIIAGTEKTKIKDAIRRQSERKGDHSMPEKWDGHAGERIVDILVRTHRARTASTQSLPQTCAEDSTTTVPV